MSRSRKAGAGATSEKITLDEWKRLNKGARPVGYLKAMVKGAGSFPMGSAPTYDPKKAPKKPDRIEVTKNAAFAAGVQDGMTRGEYDREVSAPGISGANYVGQQMDNRVERRPGDQGGRGIPEWLRTLKFMRPTWR